VSAIEPTKCTFYETVRFVHIQNHINRHFGSGVPLLRDEGERKATGRGEKNMRLGVDLGTTRTVVAASEDGNYPVCLFSWKGELKEYIPTLAAVRDGTLCFGWEASECLRRPDAQILRSFKRLTAELRPEDPVYLGPDFSLSILDLVTLFLRHVRRMIARYGNLSFGQREKPEAMIATPANAGSNQRYITLEAFKRAGFIVRGAMNEPSAAALEFHHRYLKNIGPRSPKRYVVVYDLGGGTFDTSVVGLADRNHEVIAHEGIAKLGGDDFDEVILDLVLEALGASRENLNSNQMVRLLEECRERKEGLKPTTKKMVVDPGMALAGESPVVLETKLVYERCEGLVRRSLDTTARLIRTLDQSGIYPQDARSLAALYLVGGSVNFPPVARLLREFYTTKVKISLLPHAATAIGLAIAADPHAQVRVRESVSRHFGVWREQGRDKIFDAIFLKDRQVDGETGRLRVIRRYRPVHNIGLLRYLECSILGVAGEPEGDIAAWGEVYFPYDPELKQSKRLTRIPVEPRADLSSQEILEIYEYDSQGLIQVEIKNLTAGYHRLFTLPFSKYHLNSRQLGY
jgi:molecular chaperone DnaK (HSP70)